MPVRTNAGSGVSARKDTATEADVRYPKTFHSGSGAKARIGRILDCTIRKIIPGKSAQKIPKGSYIAEDIEVAGDDNLISKNIRGGVSVFNVPGDQNVVDTSSGNLAASGMLAGQKGYSKGKLVSGDIATLSDASFSPADASAYNDCKIVGAAYNSYVGAFDYSVVGYIAGTIRIHIANLLNKNIRAGVRVGGIGGYIEGTFTNDATATEGDILAPKTAYVNGNKVPGKMVDRGNAQYGGFGEGDTYYAINKLPAGYYHSSYDWDTSWAPEARVSKDTLRAYLGITPDKIAAGKNIAGTDGTFTNDAVLDPQYLMEGQSGYDDGVLKLGTSPNRGSYGQQASGWAQYNGNLYFGFPRGTYYQTYQPGSGGAAECYIPNAQLGIDANQILRGHSIAGISGNAQKHGYAYGKVTSSSNVQIATDEGQSARFAKITLNLPFTPVVGYLIYYISGNRDITVYAPNNGSSKYGAVMNFNQRKLNGLNSAAWAHGECGVECNGPNMVLPVAYTGVAYDYWFAGYY